MNTQQQQQLWISLYRRNKRLKAFITKLLIRSTLLRIFVAVTSPVLKFACRFRLVWLQKAFLAPLNWLESQDKAIRLDHQHVQVEQRAIHAQLIKLQTLIQGQA